MIPHLGVALEPLCGKPRASGDDPEEGGGGALVVK